MDDERGAEQREGGSPSGSRWRGLVILALLAMLIVGVLYMAQQLRHAAAIQDCVASGRTNCAPIGTGR
ncbi:MAG TPA: hypothetical protein VE690_22415 [Rhodopila sp.]|nr:hypothetical protein [Rhodopila sp.]